MTSCPYHFPKIGFIHRPVDCVVNAEEITHPGDVLEMAVGQVIIK